MDDDRLLLLIGVGLVVALLVASGIAVLAAVTAPSRTPDTPVADWQLERVDGTHVRITHAGGDPVRGDRLVVSVEGYDRRADWPDRVTTGDSVVVTASEDQTIRLYWEHGRATRQQLARWQVGASEGLRGGPDEARPAPA